MTGLNRVDAVAASSVDAQNRQRESYLTHEAVPRKDGRSHLGSSARETLSRVLNQRNRRARDRRPRPFPRPSRENYSRLRDGISRDPRPTARTRGVSLRSRSSCPIPSRLSRLPRVPLGAKSVNLRFGKGSRQSFVYLKRRHLRRIYTLYGEFTNRISTLPRSTWCRSRLGNGLPFSTSNRLRSPQLLPTSRPCVPGSSDASTVERDYRNRWDARETRLKTVTLSYPGRNGRDGIRAPAMHHRQGRRLSSSCIGGR